MFVASQILAVFAGVVFALSYFAKKKNILLILSILNNIFFGTHYLLLGGFTAAYVIYLTIAFLIGIYFLEKFNKENFNFIVASLSSIFAIVITILTWQGANLSILPLIAILFVYVGCTFKNVHVVKIFNLLSTITTTINLIMMKSYFGIAQNVIILILAVVGIILGLKKARE